MICTIIGGGPGVNKIDSFKGFKIGLNYTYQYHDVDASVMFDNPNRYNPIYGNCNPPNLHTLKQWNLGTGYVSEGRQINYKEGYVGTFNTSAIMAVNVAIQLGYDTIYLVGCENRMKDKHHFYDTNSIIGIAQREMIEKSFKTIAKMWDEVEVKERLIFVDSSITKFENITIAEYKKASLS